MTHQWLIYQIFSLVFVLSIKGEDNNSFVDEYVTTSNINTEEDKNTVIDLKSTTPNIFSEEHNDRYIDEKVVTPKITTAIYHEILKDSTPNLKIAISSPHPEIDSSNDVGKLKGTFALIAWNRQRDASANESLLYQGSLHVKGAVSASVTLVGRRHATTLASAVARPGSAEPRSPDDLLILYGPVDAASRRKQVHVERIFVHPKYGESPDTHNVCILQVSAAQRAQLSGPTKHARGSSLSGL